MEKRTNGHRQGHRRDRRGLPLRRRSLPGETDQGPAHGEALQLLDLPDAGAIAVSAQVGDIEITAGQDALATYQFNTMTAKHHFCSVCGIYTHHQRRSNPDQYGVNVACLQGVSPFDFEEVKVLDGQNHPSDTGIRSDLVGVLRFIPADRMAEDADRR